MACPVPIHRHHPCPGPVPPRDDRDRSDPVEADEEISISGRIAQEDRLPWTDRSTSLPALVHRPRRVGRPRARQSEGCRSGLQAFRRGVVRVRTVIRPVPRSRHRQHLLRRFWCDNDEKCQPQKGVGQFAVAVRASPLIQGAIRRATPAFRCCSTPSQPTPRRGHGGERTPPSRPLRLAVRVEEVRS